MRSTAVRRDVTGVVDELDRAVLDVEAGTAEVFDGFNNAIAVAEFGDFDSDSTREIVFVGSVAPDVDVADSGHVGDRFDGGLEFVVVEALRGGLHEDGDTLAQQRQAGLCHEEHNDG